MFWREDSGLHMYLFLHGFTFRRTPLSLSVYIFTCFFNQETFCITQPWRDIVIEERCQIWTDGRDLIGHLMVVKLWIYCKESSSTTNPIDVNCAIAHGFSNITMRWIFSKTWLEWVYQGLWIIGIGATCHPLANRVGSIVGLNTWDKLIFLDI